MLWKCLWISSSNSVQQHVFNPHWVGSTSIWNLLKQPDCLSCWDRPETCSWATFIKYISQCSFKWSQVTVTEKSQAFTSYVHVELQWICFHSRVCLMRRKQSGLVDFQNTGKKSIQPTSTVYWISAQCAPYWGISTMDSLFHNITMDWGSFCRIKEN